MKSIDGEKEIDLFMIDWSILSEKDKIDIIDKHSLYVKLSQEMIKMTGLYTANIRSLFLIFGTTLIMSLQHYENKKILFVIICIQFLKTMFSRLTEASIFKTTKQAKQDLLSFIIKKTK